ncbi:MAG: Sir2 family NAD-dependent protein deacetylase, partial [Pseudomonadota bacterium]
MYLIVLTGAGISAESGVATFRDPDGVWAKYDWQDVATPEAFAANPALVHDFYNMRRAALPKVEPNAAHDALADLEQSLTARGDRFLLITQNVDDLHARAGSQNMLQMHGALAQVSCQHCGHETGWAADLSIETPCPACRNIGGMRPAVVWFGEMPRHLDRIEEALTEATHFAAIGTSGTVYPAAGLAAGAKAAGAETLLINLEPAE